MKGSRRSVLFASGLALALLLPPAARALLGVPGDAQAERASELRARTAPASPGAPRRPLLVRKVDKAVVRAEASLESVGEGAPLDRPPALPAVPAAPAARSELTQPTAIRIFLTSTPHNHRAPPAA
jgi:hypothetical protein